MKNIRLLVLGLIMVAATIGYAIEEPQKFIDVYDIQTKNHKHRCVLDIYYESSCNFVRDMANDELIVAMLRAGLHDAARSMRALEREHCLRFVEERRQEAQQHLKKWGYQA